MIVCLAQNFNAAVQLLFAKNLLFSSKSFKLTTTLTLVQAALRVLTIVQASTSLMLVLMTLEWQLGVDVMMTVKAFQILVQKFLLSQELVVIQTHN